MFSPASHTFVVCAYGESPYLAECVSSLMSQSVRTDVIMATSTPNELISDVASKFDVPLYVSGQEPGICSDWNHALSCVTTPLATIAHQDDVYSPTYAEHMLSGMNRAKDPLIYFTNYGELRDGVEVDENGLLTVKRLLLRPLSKRGGISSDHSVKRRILSVGSSICCPSVSFNLPALPSPLFVSTMKSNLDWETWERLARLDGSFVYDEAILMHHRIHGGSETSALIHDNTRTEEDLAMLQKFWPSPVARLINKVYSKAQSSNG